MRNRAKAVIVSVWERPFDFYVWESGGIFFFNKWILPGQPDPGYFLDPRSSFFFFNTDSFKMEWYRNKNEPCICICTGNDSICKI